MLQRLLFSCRRIRPGTPWRVADTMLKINGTTSAHIGTYDVYLNITSAGYTYISCFTINLLPVPPPLQRIPVTGEIPAIPLFDEW